MMEFVSWDYDILNMWKVIKHFPNHQPNGDDTNNPLELKDFFSDKPESWVKLHVTSVLWHVMSCSNIFLTGHVG